MRVRRLIAGEKILQSETPWKIADLPPRHAPIYAKTKPMRAGWRWRSARAIGHNGDEFYLVAECNPLRDNWKAILIQMCADGGSAIGRLEFHASHPGLHFHANCERSGVETGPESLHRLGRRPAADRRHRRTAPMSEAAFWARAKAFFRVRPEQEALDL